MIGSGVRMHGKESIERLKEFQSQVSFLNIIEIALVFYFSINNKLKGVLVFK